MAYNTTRPNSPPAHVQQQNPRSQSRSTQHTRSTNNPAPLHPNRNQPNQARWSLTQRIFNFTNWAPAQTAGATITTGTAAGRSRPTTPRNHALWSPQNHTPRTPVIPNVPVAHPDIAHTVDRPGKSKDAEGDYPLLSLPQQRGSRVSPEASSAALNRASADYSGRQSIKLPPEVKKSPLSDRFPFDISDRPSIDAGGPGPSTVAARQQRVEEIIGSKDMAHQQNLGGTSPTRDVESQRLQVLKRSPSRASLPQSRDGEHAGTHTDEADEFEWGPSHPCFPHLNPHVPVTSPLYHSTRIIRIKRDWMQVGDLAPTFSNLYPEILDPHISEEQFRRLVEHINRELIAAFSPYSARNVLDTILSVATFWLWEDFGFAAVKGRLDKLERFIADWNSNVGMKEGIALIPLRRTGYMSVSTVHSTSQGAILTSPFPARLPNTRSTDRHRSQPRLSTTYQRLRSASRCR